MHEMAICESILDVMETEARSQAFARVTRVRLAIGALSGVEIAALRFGFDAVTRGSLADGAVLEIDEVPGTAWCFECEKAVEVTSRLDPCPQCGGYRLQVTGGQDMTIKELEVG